MTYNLHDLISIEVAGNIDHIIKKNIDFQIGYYNRNKIKSNPSFSINLRQYSDFKIDNSIVELAYGTTSNHAYLHKPQEQTAIVKDDRCISIYTDNHELMINYFIELLLLEQKNTLIHAAAVVNSKNEVVLFPSKGGIGKTGIVGGLIKNYGYKLLGDDLIILSSSGECFSFLRDFVIKSYHFDTYPGIKYLEKILHQKKKKKKITDILKSNLPFVKYFNGLAREYAFFEKVKSSFVVHDDQINVPVENLFNPSNIGDRGKLKLIINLKRYSGAHLQLESISKEEFISRNMSTLFHEWSDYVRDIFLFGSFYFNDFLKIIEEQKSILEKNYDSVECLTLNIPQHADINNIIDFIQKEKL